MVIEGVVEPIAIEVTKAVVLPDHRHRRLGPMRRAGAGHRRHARHVRAGAALREALRGNCRDHLRGRGALCRRSAGQRRFRGLNRPTSPKMAAATSHWIDWNTCLLRFYKGSILFTVALPGARRRGMAGRNPATLAARFAAVDRGGAVGPRSLALVRQCRGQRLGARGNGRGLAAPLPDLGHGHRGVRDADRVSAGDRGDCRRARADRGARPLAQRSQALRGNRQQRPCRDCRVRRGVPRDGRALVLLRWREGRALDRMDRSAS